jgi:hypothetical protein
VNVCFSIRSLSLVLLRHYVLSLRSRVGGVFAPLDDETRCPLSQQLLLPSTHYLLTQFQTQFSSSLCVSASPTKSWTSSMDVPAVRNLKSRDSLELAESLQRMNTLINYMISKTQLIATYDFVSYHTKSFSVQRLECQSRCELEYFAVQNLERKSSCLHPVFRSTTTNIVCP